MKIEPRKAMVVELHFTEKPPAMQRLEALGRNLALSVNLLKGRITSEDASFKLQVAGSASNIRSFVRKTEACGASVGIGAA